MQEDTPSVPVRLGRNGPIIGEAKARKDGESIIVEMILDEPMTDNPMLGFVSNAFSIAPTYGYSEPASPTNHIDLNRLLNDVELVRRNSEITTRINRDIWRNIYGLPKINEVP